MVSPSASLQIAFCVLLQLVGFNSELSLDKDSVQKLVTGFVDDIVKNSHKAAAEPSSGRRKVEARQLDTSAEECIALKKKLTECSMRFLSDLSKASFAKLLHINSKTVDKFIADTIQCSLDAMTSREALSLCSNTISVDKVGECTRKTFLSRVGPSMSDEANRVMDDVQECLNEFQPVLVPDDDDRGYDEMDGDDDGDDRRDSRRKKVRA